VAEQTKITALGNEPHLAKGPVVSSSAPKATGSALRGRPQRCAAAEAQPQSHSATAPTRRIGFRAAEGAVREEEG
jgi:hypothetical protein